MTSYAKNFGGHGALAAGRIVTLTQQWLYLNLTRNSFYNLFPAKSIGSCLYCTFICKELVHPLAELFYTPAVNKLNNYNVVVM